MVLQRVCKGFQRLLLGVCFVATLRITTGVHSLQYQIEPKIHCCNNRIHQYSTTTQFAKSDSGGNEDTITATKKAKGVYIRPSAVIEKGSGFFVPGLEGPRVRLAVGTVLLLLTVVNHTLTETANGFQFSEGLAIFYGLFVLLQGAIESFREGITQQNAVASLSSSVDDATDDSSVVSMGSSAQLSQYWLSSFNNDNDQDGTNAKFRERVQWAATSYLSLTSATHIMLLSEKDVMYCLGASSITSSTDSNNRAVTVNAALDTVSKSSTGLVALPSDHPAYSLAPQGYNRCVVLQDLPVHRSCLMMTSDQLLASFTKQDLQWLGQLALYIYQS